VGRHENQADQKDLDALYDTFRGSGFQFRQLLLALVTSKPFLGEPDSDSGRRAVRSKSLNSEGLAAGRSTR
jgi:hypothetical protein